MSESSEAVHTQQFDTLQVDDHDDEEFVPGAWGKLVRAFFFPFSAFFLLFSPSFFPGLLLVAAFFESRVP